MQIPKEKIRQNILDAAKDEFLKNGFEKASIRRISANAGTSKSNIYNYFKDKNTLFFALVEPTLNVIEKGLKEIQKGNRKRRESYTIASQKKVMCTIVNFLYLNSDDFKLLLFCSAGSSLSGFKNEMIEQLSKILMDWVRITAPEKEISELFVRSVAGFYIGAMERILLEEKTAEQAAIHLNEFLSFVYGGWSSLL
jgi:AcrR family transcriptional regulator